MGHAAGVPGLRGDAGTPPPTWELCAELLTTHILKDGGRSSLWRL